MNGNKINFLIFDILDAGKTIFGFLIILFSLVIVFWRSIKVFFRLGKNLGQKVFIFCPTGGKRTDGTHKDMERELTVLKNSGYFDIPEGIVTDFNSIDEGNIKKCGVVVLGYHREMKNFNEFIDMVRRAGKPLIIYTFELGYQLNKKHIQKIRDYKWYALSSMPLRLVSDLFAIMASYKHEQKRS